MNTCDDCGRPMRDDDPNPLCVPCVHAREDEPTDEEPEPVETPCCYFCGVEYTDDAHAPYCSATCAIDAERS